MHTSKLVSLLASLAAVTSLASSAASEDSTQTPAAPAATRNNPASAHSAAIGQAIAHPSRSARDLSQDTDRHPAKILHFAGVDRGWKVADLAAGDGYYSSLLSTTVGDRGHVWAHNPEWLVKRFPQADAQLGVLAEQRNNVTHLVSPMEDFGHSLEEPLDAVFMVLFYHDTAWDGTDRIAMNRNIYKSLRPGGIFLVIDHHAPAGSGLAAVKDTHRIDASVVREEIGAAGFQFESESDVLANPQDSRNGNVFAEDMRRHTDRFVYLFRKPGQAP